MYVDSLLVRSVCVWEAKVAGVARGVLSAAGVGATWVFVCVPLLDVRVWNAGQP